MKVLLKIGAGVLLLVIVLAALAWMFSPISMVEPPDDTPHEVVRLWDGPAPGTEDWDIQEMWFEMETDEIPKTLLVTNVATPTMTVVRPPPEKANGMAMLVCPGGGFMVLSWDNEGMNVANWLAERGVTAFVLRYRVRSGGLFAGFGEDQENAETFEARLQAGADNIAIARADAVRALELIRANAGEYGIRPDRVGMMGFSAGAMTTMSVLLHGGGAPGSLPDFAAPVYGAMEKAALPSRLPPLFIAHSKDDKLVPFAQSVKIHEAWTRAGGEAELHLYESGGHGFGMHRSGAPTDAWTDDFAHWLSAQR